MTSKHSLARSLLIGACSEQERSAKRRPAWALVIEKTLTFLCVPIAARYSSVKSEKLHRPQYLRRLILSCVASPRPRAEEKLAAVHGCEANSFEVAAACGDEQVEHLDGVA